MDLNLLQMEREDSEEHEALDSEEHETKDTKRKKKTPLQIEMLEIAYAEDNHPSEASRMELSVKSGLTNRQIQMWFCNRRLKDRKVLKSELEMSFMQRKEDKLSLSEEPLTFYEYPAAVLASEVEDDALFRRNAWEQVTHEHEQSISEVGNRRKIQENKEFSTSLKKKSKQILSGIDPRAAAIGLLCSWGETFREDGPTLGFEFDPLPPGAFGTQLEPVRVNNSIAEVDNRISVTYGREDSNPINCVAGRKASLSSLKPTLKNVPKDKQLVVVARQHEVPQKSGSTSKVRKSKSLDSQHAWHALRTPSNPHFELNDVQYVQSVAKMPSAITPVSRKTVRPPKALLSPSIKSCMKQDGYGFEGRLKSKGELSLFAPNNSKASSNESIVSFIKQHPVSAYVKPRNKYDGDEEAVYYNYNGHVEDEGSDGDFQSSEYSDEEVNVVEAEKRICGEQGIRKGKLDFRKDYGYQLYRCHGYNTGSSGNTNE